MTKTILLSAALIAGTSFAAFAQGDTGVQGRPMGGLAMSMQDEQAMEAASMARKAPSPMRRHRMMKRHMMHNAM